MHCKYYAILLQRSGALTTIVMYRCIFQDNKQDWAEQSSHMGDIYKNASVTISAAATSNPLQSLYRPMDAKL
jgi:hypothetical protein